MEKIAVVFLDGNQVPVEKVIFKLCLKQVTGLPTSQLEFALRGFLLKLSVSDSALLPLPPGTHFTLFEKPRGSNACEDASASYEGVVFLFLKSEQMFRWS